MTDYERGVEQASTIYKEVIREYVTENEKLRKDMEDLEGYDQMLRDRLRQETELQVKSKAENEKLRELAHDLYKYFVDCECCHECCDNYPEQELCPYLKRLHALGIDPWNRPLVMVDDERGFELETGADDYVDCRV